MKINKKKQSKIMSNIIEKEKLIADSAENKMLFFDIETDGLNPEKCNLKWFGCYSRITKEYSLLDYTEKDNIRKIIESHKFICGFNNKQFDQRVLERYLKDDYIFKYKIVVDLYEISAPRGNDGYGKWNKNKLKSMGFKLKNYKLKTIVEELGLDKFGKGDIDYKIFQKDKWTKKELIEIKKYLKKDIIITKKLYEWYEEQFSPLKKLLKKYDSDRGKHITWGLPSLGYNIICNKSNKNVEWESERPTNLKSFPGGHHIENREKLTKGNIVSLDFTSAYPHALIMGNLFSPADIYTEGWANDYYNLERVYNSKNQGKVELALKEIFLERLKAKKLGDKAKSDSYKIIINSVYGTTSNYKFKSLYDPQTASDCTSMARTWLKKLAKTLEENGFYIIYGFTDNVYVKIPEESSKEELIFIANKFIEDVKKTVPFPMDTFNLELETELKMMWFAAKNCYLYVTKNNKVLYKDTLLNINTPQIIMKVFNDYMTPKIIKELDVNFTEAELKKEITKELKKNIEFGCEEYNTSNLDNYKVKTSIYYQISKKYGPGKHFLLPNLKNIGIGKSKSTKKKIGVRYCTKEEFKKNKLTYNDIDISQLIKHLKVFTKKEGNKK